MSGDLPATMTVPEAAKFLGIGRNTAYEAARTGELPAVRIGGRVVVPTHALLKMLGLEPGDTETKEARR